MPAMLKQLVITAMSVFVIGFAVAANAADTVVIIINHEVADFSAWKKKFDASASGTAEIKVGTTGSAGQ